MDFTTFLATASTASNTTAGTTTGAAAAPGGSSMLVQLLIFVVPLGLMYLLLIMPQRKKDKKAKELIGSAIVGDNVISIGGICGKIVNIKDDEITVESSVDRTKITLKKWSIKEVVKPLVDK